MTLTGSQVRALATFVVKRDNKGLEAWSSAPQQAVDGAMLYAANQCALCHVLNGTGQKNGPPLNGLATRRARDWVERHFAEPMQLSPGSTMPAYKFNSRDLDRITTYLLAIPK
jgi:cbb3-type cytochrome oxidase cytochrome c subunit